MKIILSLVLTLTALFGNHCGRRERIENPRDCRCDCTSGKMICNSACRPGTKRC